MSNELDRRAREILRANDMGGYTVPTGGLYPYQWNWDSVFVALGFATFDESRACEEIETLFDAQWDDGMVPHIVFRQNDPDYFPGPGVWNAGAELPTSGITQPPVAATVVRTLWESSVREDVKSRLAALFPKMLAWHRWFHTYRVLADVGAVITTHPWESGRDNSPEWDAPAANIDVSSVQPYQRRDLQHADAAMRPTKLDYDRYMALVDFGRTTGWDHELIARNGPYRVADVGMTMILLRATRDLASLAIALGYDDARAELDGHVSLLEQGADYLWDDCAQTFCSRDTITGNHSGFVTSASFLYCYAGVGDPTQEAQMAQHWDRIGATSRYMMPSHPPDDAKFDAMRYWRGPIWMVINYMLASGFRSAGKYDWAVRIESDSRKLIEGHGFHEAFSPLNGKGTGGNDFSWTAAMWLAWCGTDSDQAFG